MFANSITKVFICCYLTNSINNERIFLKWRNEVVKLRFRLSQSLPIWICNLKWNEMKKNENENENDDFKMSIFIFLFHPSYMVIRMRDANKKSASISRWNDLKVSNTTLQIHFWKLNFKTQFANAVLQRVLQSTNKSERQHYFLILILLSRNCMDMFLMLFCVLSTDLV